MSQQGWDEYFIGLARHAASKSKDKSTKVGCVITGPDHEVRTTGYNGLCRGLMDDIPERDMRPEKYFWYEHSERNAIYNAARMGGVSLKGCTAYISSIDAQGGQTVEFPPCADCARSLIQSGIIRVIWEKAIDPTDRDQRWQDSHKAAQEMLKEAGVSIV